MIFHGVFKKAVFISALSHIALFSIFSLSFGQRMPVLNFPHISFLGQILSNADLTRAPYFSSNLLDDPRAVFKKNSGISVLGKVSKEGYFNERDYLNPVINTAMSSSDTIVSNGVKPQVTVVLSREKAVFVPRIVSDIVMHRKKEPVIMFYPQLPYHFLLYFKDRQMVHIELMFNIVSKEKNNSVLIKRKIASGNLEADLLCMRYISRYLLIEQPVFAPNSWQNVKIDLAPKNDKRGHD